LTIDDSWHTALAALVVGAAFTAQRFKLSSPEGALSLTLDFPAQSSAEIAIERETVGLYLAGSGTGSVQTERTVVTGLAAVELLRFR
jgi:hypothetical protein